MLTFALEKLDEVRNGILSFYKIRINGECLYDDFCKKIEQNKIERKQLITIQAYMNMMANNNQRLPKNKFNSIKQGDKVIGYEFKTDKLRIYVAKQEPNIFVILGGHKTSQTKDVAKFKRIIFSEEFANLISNLKPEDIIK